MSVCVRGGRARRERIKRKTVRNEREQTDRVKGQDRLGSIDFGGNQSMTKTTLSSKPGHFSLGWHPVQETKNLNPKTGSSPGEAPSIQLMKRPFTMIL